MLEWLGTQACRGVRGAVQLNRRWSDVNWLRSETSGAPEMAFWAFRESCCGRLGHGHCRGRFKSGISAAGTCAVDRTIAAATTTRRRAGGRAAFRQFGSQSLLRKRTLQFFTTFTRFTLFGFPLSSFLSHSLSLSTTPLHTLRHQHELAGVSLTLS